MTPVKQIAILAGVGLVVAAAILIGPGDLLDEMAEPQAGPAPSVAANEPAPVIVQNVRFASAAAVVEAVGTGQAGSAVTLFPEAAGRVTAVLFAAGEQVDRDMPLLRLDSEEEKLAVELARIHLEDARRQLGRYEQAAPSGAVSTSEVDAARAALAAARIELAQTELALRQRTLIAPFDGVVGIPEVEVGDRITESMPVATLDDRSTILVDFEVPEAFAYGVQIGGAVEATTWALPDERFTGAVESVASRIDPQTRTLRVRALLPNEDGRLRTGMSFVIRLPLEGERFPSVPSIAVQWDRRGAYVWRVTDGAVERIEIAVLKRENEWVLVNAPLNRGDRIVVEGVQRLRPGRAVEIVSADTVAATEPENGI